MSMRSTSGAQSRALEQHVPPVLSQRSTPAVDNLFATLVEASFDLLEEVGSTDLAIYLHVPHSDQPILFARNPRLETLPATETFRLMHTTTMLTNGRKPVSAFRHGDLNGHYVRTTGEMSDGLFLFGPIQQPQSARRMVAICRAFARVLHQFHLDEVEGSFNPPMLSIEAVDDGGQEATVTVQTPQGDRQATMTGTTPEEAVARAVLEAVATGHELNEVRTLVVGTKSAVLVVSHDSDGVLRLGLAISEGDILQTVAVAAERTVTEGPAGQPDEPVGSSSSSS